VFARAALAALIFVLEIGICLGSPEGSQVAIPSSAKRGAADNVIFVGICDFPINCKRIYVRKNPAPGRRVGFFNRVSVERVKLAALESDILRVMGRTQWYRENSIIGATINANGNRDDCRVIIPRVCDCYSECDRNVLTYWWITNISQLYAGPMGRIVFALRQFERFAHFAGLIVGPFSKPPSLQPQTNSRSGQNTSKDRRPSRRRVPPWRIILACLLGGCIGAIVSWPYKKKPRKFNRDNNKGKN